MTYVLILWVLSHGDVAINEQQFINRTQCQAALTTALAQNIDPLHSGWTIHGFCLAVPKDK